MDSIFFLMSTEQTTVNALIAPTSNLSYAARIEREGQKLVLAVDNWELALNEKQPAKVIKELHDEIMNHKNIIEMLKFAMKTSDEIEASFAAETAPLSASNEEIKYRIPEKLPRFAPRVSNGARFFDLAEYLDEFELCLTAFQTPKAAWTHALLSTVDNDLELSKWILHEIIYLDWESAKALIIAKLSHPQAQEQLERKLQAMKISANDSISKYTDKFTSLAIRVGRKMTEKLLIQHFLLSLPSQYITIARNCGLDFDDVGSASLWAQKIEASVLFEDISSTEKKIVSKCSRCRSAGHSEEQCKRVVCSFCKALGHLESECRKKAALNNKKTIDQRYPPKLEITCFKCKAKGHLASGCTSNKPSLNTIEDSQDDLSAEDYAWLIKQENSPYLIPLFVNKTKILATLDTGASASILSTEIARKLALKVSVKNPTTFKLAQKDIESSCRGTASVTITCNGRTITTRLHIMDLNEDVNMLLGRDLIGQFKFIIGNIPHSFDNNPSQASGEYIETIARLTEDPLDDPTRQVLLSNIRSRVEDNLKTSTLFCNLEESKVHLRTHDSSASFVRQYPIARKFQEPINKIVQDWINTGVVVPSPQGCRWNSPLLAVEKKDSDGNLTAVRVCLDPRRINEKLLDDNYPIPEIKSILNRLEGFSIFSTIDLASSYNQFEIAEQDREKTAFTWNNCQYMFAGAPFGLKTMTSIFQRVTSRLFSDLPYVCTYVDDILICSKTTQEHVKNLHTVLERLTKANLTINPDKCRFAYSSVKLLGHVVSSKGISLDKKKLEKAAAWPKPRTSDDISKLLGFTNYLRNSIPLYAKITAPLEKLRYPPKTSVEHSWTDDCDQSFKTLKDIIVKAPMLCFPDFSRPLIIATDASNHGLGAVLFQSENISSWNLPKETIAQTIMDGKHQYINFAARALTAGERNYSATKRELAGLVFALRKFHNIIWGSKFILLTDHRALTFLHTQKHTNPMINNWLETLLNYNYEIYHCPGIQNILPDYLSRLFPSFATKCSRSPELLQATKTASMIPSLSDYTAENCKRITAKEQQKEILLRQHLKGHFGANAMTKAIIHNGFHWKNLREDCIETVKECGACQRFTIVKQGFHPLTPIGADLPFDHVAIDLLGPMPTTSDGYNYILVLVDVNSRFTLLRALKDKSAISVARELMLIFTDFGFPKIIQSDNGKEFVNSIIESLFKTFKIDKRLTSPYHPRANGLAERFIQTTLGVLKKELYGDNTKWKTILPATQLMMNDKISVIHNSTPFSVMFARKLNPFDNYEAASSNSQPKEEFEKRLRFIDTVLRPALITANEKSKSRTKERFDKSHRLINFPIGSLVMIVNNTKENKLETSYEGPYKVLKLHKGGSYTLQDAAGVLLSKGVPPSQMKLISGDNDNTSRVESIVDHKKTNKGILYRVRWEGYSEADDTWEPKDSFHDPSTITDYYKRRSASEGGQC